MTLRELEYIVAVAEDGHFGRAAQRCNVSQPTLSGQIRKLEDALGVVLFERRSDGARVTEAGRAIIAEARQALASAARIRELAQHAQDPLAGRLHIGLIPTIAPYLIPFLVSNLKTALPQLSPVYHEDITERLTEELDEGRLDAAVLATPPASDRHIALPLYTEPFDIVMRASHPLADKSTLTVSDIDPASLLLLTEGHCFRDQALEFCGLGSDPIEGVRATSLETLVNLVASGEGMTLIPRLMLFGRARTDLAIRPVQGNGASRTVQLVFRKSSPRQDLFATIADIVRSSVAETFSARPLPG